MARADIRHYLTGVMVEPRTEGGAFIVGTDGHRLVAIIDKDAICSEQRILKLDAKTVSQLPLVGSRHDQDGARVNLVEFVGKPALFVTDHDGLPKHAQVRDATVDIGNSRYTYPRWRKVLPDFPKLERALCNGFAMPYFTDVLQAFSTGERMQTCHLFQGGPGTGIVAHIERHNNVLVIVMPRQRDDSYSTDAWRKTFEPLRDVAKDATPAKEVATEGAAA
jgi:hypothetical protein